MLRRVHIRGYKSLADVDITLEPLSVIFGPNAAGKSNLLDALQLLSRLATSRTLQDAFEPPYRGKPLESFTFGPGGIRELLHHETVSFTLEVDVELTQTTVDAINRRASDLLPARAAHGASSAGNGERPRSYVHERHLRYRVEIQMRPRQGILQVVDEYLTALTRDGQPKASRAPYLERVGDQLHLRAERRGRPLYHDLYQDRTVLSLAHYVPHYPHVVAMRHELENWQFCYFEPRERMRTPSPVREVHHVGLMGEDLAAFLNTLHALDEPQFRAVERALREIVPSVTGLEVNVSDLGEVDLLLYEGPKPMPSRVVSEGTLRVLGLLALGGAKVPPTLIGFEEPENGIHPRRIRMVADLLQNRVRYGNTQLIVTTHSPVLLDQIPVRSLYLCRKDAGATQIMRLHDVGELGDLSRQREIVRALDEDSFSEDGPLVSERLLRGDFDA